LSGKEKGVGVLKTILKTSGCAVLLLVLNAANATGLGGIVVSSNLGQPLQAVIELVAVDKGDRASISARLAPADAFKRAGIDYPYALPRLKFEITNRDSDQPRIRITSAQPVNEPFVTLLVEAVWSSGKLMREYTFLLDPVGFNPPEQATLIIPPVTPSVTPVVVEPAAPESVTAAPVGAKTPAAETVAAAEPVSTNAEEEVEATATPEQAMLPAAVIVDKVETAPAQEDVLSREEFIPLDEAQSAPIAVVRGDTLSKIALKTKPAEVSLERMLVALYRANTHAFAGNNMNRLMAGKIINLPDAAQIEAVGQREAVREYRAQVADWNSYRQQLAAARAATAEQASSQSASGKVTASVAEPAAAKDSAGEVLKLSKGEAPGDKAAGSSSTSEAEDAIAREKALQDAEERTALLEKNVKDLERLAELKKQQAQTGATSATAAVAGVAPAEMPKSAKPALPAAPLAQPEAPSFLDELLANPLFLAVTVGVLVLLGGGVWWSRRRGKVQPPLAASTDGDLGSTTGRIAEPIVPSPETGDFTRNEAQTAEGVQAQDEVDPLAEADLFLSFGRDAQAEEVLKDALSKKPGDLPVTIKLLSIYANRKDANAFLIYARQVKESGDEEAWSTVVAIGRELEPNNPLYGGTGEAVAEPSAAPSRVADPAAVDFDLGFGSTGTSPSTDFLATEVMHAEEIAPGSRADEAPSLPDTMIAEPPSQETTAILSSEELRSAQEAPMDFDITGTHPPVSPVAAPQQDSTADDLIFDITSTRPGREVAPGLVEASENVVGDLIFDVTATHPGVPATEPEKQSAADDGGLTFDLDIPDTFKQPKDQADVPLEIGLGDISLDLDGSAVRGDTASDKDEHWQEVATKLDLAKAYQEMGDAAGAREILDEVMRDGDEQQRAGAQTMLDQL